MNKREKKKVAPAVTCNSKQDLPTPLQISPPPQIKSNSKEAIKIREFASTVVLFVCFFSREQSKERERERKYEKLFGTFWRPHGKELKQAGGERTCVPNHNVLQNGCCCVRGRGARGEGQQTLNKYLYPAAAALFGVAITISTLF